MRRMLASAVVATLLLSTLSTADARPNRPPKPVEYYRFSVAHLDRRLDAFGDGYERYTLLNELETSVASGDVMCRLAWKGRRVEMYLGEADSVQVDILVPAHAELRDFRVFRVAADGRDGRELESSELSGVVTDTVVVLRVANEPSWPIVDVQYTFASETFGVDETFVFRMPWPTLEAEYRFGVDRDLWREAVANRYQWEFEALAHPRTWLPTRADTPDRFTWYWQEKNIDPTAPGVPDSLTVEGLLPAPFLAEFDPDEVEKALKQRRFREIHNEPLLGVTPFITGRFGHLRRFLDSRPEDFGETVPVGPDHKRESQGDRDPAEDK